MRLAIGPGHAEHVQNLLAVDRMAGRKADARIVERLLRTPEEQIFVLCRQNLVNREARVLRDGLDLFLFKTLDDIGAAVEERQRASPRVADVMIFDAGNLRLAQEEIGIGGKEGGIALLFDKFERSGAVHARRQLLRVGDVLGRQDRQKRRQIVVLSGRIALPLGVDAASVIVDDVDL